ncbi:zinc finger protein 1035 [Brachionichthys hirsutus]|uniref:zinc finger protein 1035 n=1 Tax=Brachionichthys hirsutus TaxID=412623 RepID=UPI0036044A5C
MHRDDAFTCRFCNKAYSVKKSLSRHYKKWHQQEQKEYSDTQEKKSAEKQLGSQVSTTESYEDDNNETEDSDSDSAPYFPCHVCGKTFPTSEILEDHQRCHLGEKPHECAECGRCFFQASQLQQHQRMHKSDFQCQACGRGFVSLFALRKHKHNHGKHRRYRCSKCDFSFTKPAQLAEHMSTHREENFPCDICNRMFLSKSGRAEHRKCHSKSGGHRSHSFSRTEHKESDSHSEVSTVYKELKYRCGVCSERFGDPEKLSEHGCMAAKERPHTCLACDKHFLHASHLKKHTTTHVLSFSTAGDGLRFDLALPPSIASLVRQGADRFCADPQGGPRRPLGEMSA